MSNFYCIEYKWENRTLRTPIIKYTNILEIEFYLYKEKNCCKKKTMADQTGKIFTLIDRVFQNLNIRISIK